jgi:VanZ family protein
LAALSGYMAVKGCGIIAKMGEILIAFTVICLVINLVTVESDVNFMCNFPLFTARAGDFFKTADRYLLWTGDFMPLIVFNISDKQKKAGDADCVDGADKKRKKPSKTIPLMIAMTALATVVHYIFLNAVFKSSAGKVDNLLVALGTFNVGNILVGRTDVLSLAVWFIMAVMNLALSLAAATECSSYFLKDRRAGTAAVIVFTAIMYVLVFKNINRSFEFATGYVRYFIFAVEVCLPLLMIFGHKISTRKMRILSARRR